MDFIHSFTYSWEARALDWASWSSIASIQDFIGIAEESNFSLGGEDWEALGVVLGMGSVRIPFPLSRLFGGIICFEEIPWLENQGENLYLL